MEVLADLAPPYFIFSSSISPTFWLHHVHHRAISRHNLIKYSSPQSCPFRLQPDLTIGCQSTIFSWTSPSSSRTGILTVSRLLQTRETCVHVQPALAVARKSGLTVLPDGLREIMFSELAARDLALIAAISRRLYYLSQQKLYSTVTARSASPFNALYAALSEGSQRHDHDARLDIFSPAAAGDKVAMVLSMRQLAVHSFIHHLKLHGNYQAPHEELMHKLSRVFPLLPQLISFSFAPAFGEDRHANKFTAAIGTSVLLALRRSTIKHLELRNVCFQDPGDWHIIACQREACQPPRDISFYTVTNDYDFNIEISEDWSRNWSGSCLHEDPWPLETISMLGYSHSSCRFTDSIFGPLLKLCSSTLRSFTIAGWSGTHVTTLGEHP